MNTLKNNFEAISPYSDEQVPDVIKSLKKDKDFHSSISTELFPLVSRLFPRLGSFLFKQIFVKSFGESTTIEEFQNSLAPFVKKMVDKTTSGFTYSGIENLTAKPTLYISNHRDISLDPLFLNFARFLEGFNTVRIAVGDNLLDGRFFEKLMRLNKSFVVHRNIHGAKETLKKLSNLSTYIDHSIQSDKESIWIAQLDGRAIDGNDLTDPAVLKMLYLSNRKLLQVQDWVKSVNLTPICISYEYDPLDIIKAFGWAGWEELSDQENNRRDLSEMVKGIKDPKGRVHLHICKSIEGNCSTIEELAELIDKAIISNYKLCASNYIAAHTLDLIAKEENNFMNEEISFLERFKDLDIEVRKKVLEMYAAPLINSKQRG